jgi:hypothetical protein
MNCSAFHKNLEDYLQGGLDFGGRFGMERHAQQCFSCGKELGDAQNLRRMVAGLTCVKAPADFEAGVREAIARRRTQGLFHRFRNYWNYSLEWPSRQRMAWAASTLAILGFGLFFAMHKDTMRPTPPMAAIEHQSMPMPASIPAKIEPKKAPKVSTVQMPAMAKIQRPLQEEIETEPAMPEIFQDQEYPRVQSVDYLLVGPDNQPRPERLPNRLYMQYGPPSTEHFIRNVSH